jgi:hypothetical protein
LCRHLTEITTFVEVAYPMSSAVRTQSPIDALEQAVEQVQAAVRPAVLADPVDNALQAEESLRQALRTVHEAAVISDEAMEQAVACAEAACEHLRYFELPEARILLVAARGQLSRSHALHGDLSPERV